MQKHMLVRMASKISKNYTYKCVDRSRYYGIKGAKSKCASLAIPTDITFWKCFCILFIYFFVVALATTVSSLLDEGTVR